ncbi:hypothetical protein MRX96_004478 [Rhipicephalus microplus]
MQRVLYRCEELHALQSGIGGARHRRETLQDPLCGTPPGGPMMHRGLEKPAAEEPMWVSSDGAKVSFFYAARRKVMLPADGQKERNNEALPSCCEVDPLANAYASDIAAL